MVTVRVRETIGCAPETLLEFVMDIERYQHVDHKIRPVDRVSRDATTTEFRCHPRLGGLPTPTRAVQRMWLTPGQRVDIGLAPPPRNRLLNRMATFRASFECVPVDGGTRLTRTLSFRFSPAVRWFFEPLLNRRLPAEVREEVRLAKWHLERDGS